MTPAPHITDRAALALLWALWRQGRDTDQIARQMHVSEATIYNTLAHRQAWVPTLSPAARMVEGRP